MSEWKPICPETEPRPKSEWHEDMGCVLWWDFPIEEPPYCGSLFDRHFPFYKTHFTPIPIPQPPKD